MVIEAIRAAGRGEGNWRKVHDDYWCHAGWWVADEVS